MTTVTVTRDGSQVRAIRVSGHAGYAESGEDIVCAAASVLITTCANALESVAGVKPRVTQSDKDTVIQVALPDQMTQRQAHDGAIVMHTVLQGFSDIASEYPRYLQIK